VGGEQSLGCCTRVVTTATSLLGVSQQFMLVTRALSEKRNTQGSVYCEVRLSPHLA
jgi:hypothetical protein